MTSIRTLAAEFASQTFEVASALDLGATYDETAQLDAATEAEYREVLELIAAQRADLA